MIEPVTAELPEGCYWVDATSWTCSAACEPSWPVPSAVTADGWLDLYTPEGLQLCGGVVRDGCGRSSELPGCPGDASCGYEQTHVCGDCRVDTSAAALEACAQVGRSVPVLGCERRGVVDKWQIAECIQHSLFTTTATRTIECCARAPEGID